MSIDIHEYYPNGSHLSEMICRPLPTRFQIERGDPESFVAIGIADPEDYLPEDQRNYVMAHEDTLNYIFFSQDMYGTRLYARLIDNCGIRVFTSAFLKSKTLMAYPSTGVYDSHGNPFIRDAEDQIRRSRDFATEWNHFQEQRSNAYQDAMHRLHCDECGWEREHAPDCFTEFTPDRVLDIYNGGEYSEPDQDEGGIVNPLGESRSMSRESGTARLPKPEQLDCYSGPYFNAFAAALGQDTKHYYQARRSLFPRSVIERKTSDARNE